jgi:isopentenyl-diphosphate delta-isomerase
LTDGIRRKSEHLDIVLKGDAVGREVGNGLEAVRFEHVALPELMLSEIDLSTMFLGKRLAAPLLVSSMTGGPERSAEINQAIAAACQTLRIAFGVGSQRVALEGQGEGGLGASLRRTAPNAVILANFGAAQLKTWDGPAMARRAIDMIEADALIVHINPLQEAVQPEGDRDWRGLLDMIGALQAALPVPVIVKEVGAGLSGRMAAALWERGIRVLDVAGAGGTSWAMVEAERAPSPRARRVGATFRDWGIPTARAISDVRAVCPEATIIASGGIRTGLDAAKAIRLGADMAGMAAGVLAAALDGHNALVEHLSAVFDELRIACFCTGSKDLAALRRARLL